MLLHEIKIDNRNGAGAVPHNQGVNYFGLSVLMKPSVFLQLATPLSDNHNSDLENYILGGGKIGAPYLDIRLPETWDQGDFSLPAKVVGHEGRHRMAAILKLEGDHPIETHLFPTGGYRARDLTIEFKAELAKGLQAEKRDALISNPFSLVSG